MSKPSREEKYLLKKAINYYRRYERVKAMREFPELLKAHNDKLRQRLEELQRDWP